jgi:hypothetical protein
MTKVMIKAWFRRRWHVYGVSPRGDRYWLATFAIPEHAANWTYDLTGEWALAVPNGERK